MIESEWMGSFLYLRDSYNEQELYLVHESIKQTQLSVARDKTLVEFLTVLRYFRFSKIN
jgi:hypothetical protein